MVFNSETAIILSLVRVSLSFDDLKSVNDISPHTEIKVLLSIKYKYI